MTGCSSKLFSDLAGAVLFLGTSQMFEICPLSRALSLLARPQSHLKKKNPATIFKSFISALDARSAPNYDTSSRRGLEVEAAAGCDVGSWIWSVEGCGFTSAAGHVWQQESVNQQVSLSKMLKPYQFQIWPLTSACLRGVMVQRMCSQADIYSTAETKSRSVNESINRKCICNNRENHLILQSASFELFL